MEKNEYRWLRIYDNPNFCDRFTVIFTNRKKQLGYIPVLAMGYDMSSPLGFCQHTDYQYQIDVDKWGWPPKIGKSNHLGKRIKLEDLPEEHQKFIKNEYNDYWNKTASKLTNVIEKKLINETKNMINFMASHNGVLN
jgi:hypothetical protein